VNPLRKFVSDSDTGIVFDFCQKSYCILAWTAKF